MATAAKRIDEQDDMGRVDQDYRPSAAEEFMNPQQQQYFRRKLLDWKESIPVSYTHLTLPTIYSV